MDELEKRLAAAELLLFEVAPWLGEGIFTTPRERSGPGYWATSPKGSARSGCMRCSC